LGLILKIIGVVLGIIGLAAVALILYLVVASHNSPAVPPRPVITSRVTTVSTAGQAPSGGLAADASARAKLNTLLSVIRSAPRLSHRPVTTTLSQAEVNALVVEQLQQNPNFPLRNPYIVLKPDHVLLIGDYDVSFVTMTVTTDMTVSVDNGVPKVHVQSIQADGVDVPASVSDSLNQQIAQQTQSSLSDYPFTVQQISIGDGTMTVSGVTK
jgi:hypothetical protein